MDRKERRKMLGERPSRLEIFRSTWIIFFWGVILSCLFTTFYPLGIVSGWKFGDDEGFAPPSIDSDFSYPTPTISPYQRIGIVAGHWGTDTGAVCPDGLTEVSINLAVATLVKELLIAEGYKVDLLMENDEKLEGYQALVLVSIHADTCVFLGTEATGYKVATTLATERTDQADRLLACLSSRYQTSTQLPFHGGVTDDMTSYHAFGEINDNTIGAIIETGFMNLDRQILTTQSDLVAQGVVNGILCFLRNEDASFPTSP